MIATKNNRKHLKVTKNKTELDFKVNTTEDGEEVVIDLKELILLDDMHKSVINKYVDNVFPNSSNGQILNRHVLNTLLFVNNDITDLRHCKYWLNDLFESIDYEGIIDYKWQKDRIIDLFCDYIIEALLNSYNDRNTYQHIPNQAVLDLTKGKEILIREYNQYIWERYFKYLSEL